MFKKKLSNFPKVNLIPIDITIEKTGKKRRLALLTMFGLIAIGIAAGISVLFLGNLSEKSKLNSINSEIELVKLEQIEFSDFSYYELEGSKLKSLRNEVTAKEINWASFIETLINSVPTNSQIYSLDIVESEPTQETPEEIDTEEPLDADKSGDDTTADTPEVSSKNTVFNAVVLTPDLPSLKSWETTLKTLSEIGFEKISFAESVNQDGIYRTTIQLEFNEKLLWNRFGDTNE